MNETHVGSGTADALTLQFLTWLAAEPRTYADAMETWRSSCPRLLTWEDALAAGLIAIEHLTGKDYRQATVALTSRGRLLVEAIVASNPPPMNGDARDSNLSDGSESFHPS